MKIVPHKVNKLSIKEKPISTKNVSIVIPAYNEEKRIKRTLLLFIKYFTRYLKDFEIIVEMDGCLDKTSQIVRHLAEQFPFIRYIEFKEKLGKGGGILKGISIANGDIIGFVDADGAIHPTEIIKLLDEFRNNNVDGVIASRRAKGSKVFGLSSLRHFLSIGYTILVKLFFLLPYSDTQCGAKFFRKEVIKSIAPLVKMKDYSFDVNLLYLAKKMGYNIKEIGIKWHHVTGSKVNIKWETVRMLLSLIKLRLYYSPFRFIVDK